MELTRRNALVIGLLTAVWALVIIWQGEEHLRVRRAARNDLSHRSRDIANTISACIRGMRFRGAVWQERLEPVLQELVNSRNSELVHASELTSIALLNAAGEPVATAGRPIDFSQREILQNGVRWGRDTVTFISPVDLGGSLSPADRTNPTVVLPPFRALTNAFREGTRPPPPPPRHEPELEPIERGPEISEGASNVLVHAGNTPREGPRRFRDGEFRPRRPRWVGGMSDMEYQALVQKRALHGLVIAMSTDTFQATLNRDFWLRAIICLLATVSAVGGAFAWRNLVKSSDLQIRLVRASELNTHLKEMNLAAAGLAHETRNPLNIIRGRAQMISKQAETAPEVQQTAQQIVNEADKVAAQLNEFINYSRPREVRWAALALGSVINEVVRALSYDLEEKQVQLDVRCEPFRIEADEPLLRQALFNLLLNSVQAVNAGGQIEVIAEKRNSSEAWVEVRDNGPGVPPERRTEIFKPYFTTQKRGTGLGLAVVQQIVLAHGWDIECLANHPQGAVFRISHLRLAV